MQAAQTDRIRSRLRGKSLGLFDMLADGGAVDVETLFEGLNSQEGDFRASDMAERIRRYAARLNLDLAPHGLRAAQVGASRYIIETIVAPKKASMFFFEKKNQKTFGHLRTSTG